MHPILVCCLFLTLMPALSASEPDPAWIARIRPDHPRMFLNQDLLAQVRANAAGPLAEHGQYLRDKCRGYLDNDDIQFHVYECTLPEMMMLFFIDGDKALKEKSLWVLKTGAKHVRESFRKRKAVSWFSFARIALFMGYDWLYQDLAQEERQSIAKDLIDNVRELNDPANVKRVDGENYFGFPDGGFYGVRNLKWFAGLCFHGEGVADQEMKRWLVEGLADYHKLAEFRKTSGGDDGGMSSVVMGYVFGAYPRAEWNLIHTWRSAIGDNIAPDFAYLANITNWLAWRTINGGKAGMLNFGPGDEHHTTNTQGLSNNHLVQIQNFFAASHPEQARVAAYLRDLNTKGDLRGFHFEAIYPLLLDWQGFDPKSFAPLGPDQTWAHARHFEFLGEFHLRSGFGPDDTYCLFTAGNQGAGHLHKDETNFCIYKQGFLALDSGSREDKNNAHNADYYAQTIAHNCVVIQMPGESFPHHWGHVPKRNGGGQDKDSGTVIRAFATSDLYTYVNADATPVYSAKKASLVNRQFLFIHPDHFVVVDRVTSTDPAFAKTWLLHVQDKPEVDGLTMKSIQGEGVMFTKTLYPTDATLELIGGPGREFLVDGVNQPLTPAWYKKQAKNGVADPLTGHWRLEVAPGQARTEDIFIHVLEVGSTDSLKAMHDANLSVTGDGFRLSLDLGDGRHANLTLDKQSPLVGHLTIRQGTQTLINEALPQTVAPQSTITGH